MPKNDDLDFDSIFNDDNKPEDFNFDEDQILSFENETTHKINKEIAIDTPISQTDNDKSSKKRSSEDFSPDMDALLITAQSPMIIEGVKCLNLHDYSSKTLSIYIEAIKGIDLYIKIIDRSPKNYHKLSDTINNDIDCKEVKGIAINFYRDKFNDTPQTEDQMIKAFEIFKEKLIDGYKKALISNSMVKIKDYFLLSGGLDNYKIDNLIKSSNKEFRKEILLLNQNIKFAMQLLKSNDVEIVRGIKGKDVNIFIIKSSMLLSYYYQALGNFKGKDYFNRIHNIYKKYFIVR